MAESLGAQSTDFVSASAVLGASALPAAELAPRALRARSSGLCSPRSAQAFSTGDAPNTNQGWAVEVVMTPTRPRRDHILWRPPAQQQLDDRIDNFPRQFWSWHWRTVIPSPRSFKAFPTVPNSTIDRDRAFLACAAVDTPTTQSSIPYFGHTSRPILRSIALHPSQHRPCSRCIGSSAIVQNSDTGTPPRRCPLPHTFAKDTGR